MRAISLVPIPNGPAREIPELIHRELAGSRAIARHYSLRLTETFVSNISFFVSSFFCHFVIDSLFTTSHSASALRPMMPLHARRIAPSDANEFVE